MNFENWCVFVGLVTQIIICKLDYPVLICVLDSSVYELDEL